MPERAFAHHILDELVPTLAIHTEEHREAFGERLLAGLLGLDGPTGPVGPPLDRRKLFLQKVVGRLSDIDSALTSIRMPAVFCRQFPARRIYEAQGITESSYLKYHLEHYWQELYRLRESLLALVRIVARQAARDARDDGEKASIKHLEERVETALQDGFEDVSRFRGRLVHESRYRDDDLERMDSLQLILTHFEGQDREVFASLHDEIYKTRRAIAARQIESTAASLEREVDKVYTALDAILYGRSGPPDPSTARSM